MRVNRLNCGPWCPPEDRRFPSRTTCRTCGGRGSWQTHRQTFHGPADGESCEVCGGLGYRFSPDCRATRRRRITLHHIERSAA